MVTLQGVVVPVPDGDPVLLSGIADTVGSIAAVKLDDGRQFLVARKDLEELVPDTEPEVGT